MAHPEALAEIAAELYGAPLDDFTSTRNGRASAAKKSGDRELAAAVAALPKPSAAAWASNLLFRSSDDVARDLSRLRDDIAAATGSGDRDAVKELSRSRHVLIGRLVEEARSLAESAGRPLSPSASDELSEALSAALADRFVAAAMATGRLVRAPEPGGMSRGDLTAVVALPPDELTAANGDDEEDSGDDAAVSPPSRPRAVRSSATGTSAPSSERSSARDRRSPPPDGPSPAERRRHERDLRAAESRAEEARADRERREQERDTLVSRRDELAQEVARQRDVLHALERRLDDADDAVKARTADNRSRELDWKRAEAEARAARRVIEEDRATDGEAQDDGKTQDDGEDDG
jgi:hypothetical protein